MGNEFQIHAFTFH